MLDSAFIRKNKDIVKAALGRRGYDFNVEEFDRLDAQRNLSQQKAERIFALQKVNSGEVAKARRHEQDASALISHGESLRLQADEANRDMASALDAISVFLADVPNIPSHEVPDGGGEVDNVLLREFGQPRVFDFSPKTHDEIGSRLNGLDFDAAASMSGARFAVAYGDIARLHRALVQFMLDTHVDENGYREVEVPYLVRSSALEGTGQLPKFEDDLFKLERDNLYLIPTAEVPVTNLVANQVVKHADLPIAYVSHTPCFRREAGSAGRDMKGLIRQHQFHKVELVRFCTQEQSAEQFKKLLSHAESILQKLELPYRTMSLCAGDIGFSSEKTVDLEVWLPGQMAWREISSVSSFGTFQARRMKAKYKDISGKNQLLCTLNGSGLAAGRALVAVLENYQKEDGTVAVPTVLQPYMNGKTFVG